MLYIKYCVNMLSRHDAMSRFVPSAPVESAVLWTLSASGLSPGRSESVGPFAVVYSAIHVVY